MTLYHGTSMRVLTPSLKKGKPNNDYGRGFYCTEDIEMAREWACKGERPPTYVHSYELNAKGLTVLNLSQSPFSVLNWIAVLLANRTFQIDLEVAVTVRDYLLANFLPPIGEADVVIGYRADDSYFSYAETFVDNGLSVRRLNDDLRLAKLGMQVALVSQKAFRHLKHIGTEPVEWADYHPRYVRRDTSARETWREEIKTSTVNPDDLFALDIVRRNLRLMFHRGYYGERAVNVRLSHVRQPLPDQSAKPQGAEPPSDYVAASRTTSRDVEASTLSRQVPNVSLRVDKRRFDRRLPRAQSPHRRHQ